MILTMTFWKRQNCGDKERMSGCQGSGWGGVSRWSTGGLQGREAALCETVTADTRHHTVVRPAECKLCQPRTLCSSSIDQCIPTYRHWFSNYNKHTDVNNRGRNVWRLEDRGHVGTLYFVTNFSVNWSLLQKV